MDHIINNLKNLSFENKELEQRRLRIITALENKMSFPTKDLDAYILTKGGIQLMEADKVKEIDEWFEYTKTWQGKIHDLALTYWNNIVWNVAKTIFLTRVKLHKLYESLVDKVTPIIKVVRDFFHRFGLKD